MSRDRKGPTGREAIDEIETRLGDLFGALGNALNGVLDMANSEDARRPGGMERSFDLSKGPVRAQSSIRVRVGGLGGSEGEPERDLTQPVNKSKAGDDRASKPEPGIQTPVVDTYLDEDAWVLTAELPGIPEDAVKIQVTGQSMDISAEGVRSYKTRVDIPEGLDAESLSHTVTNGILELRGRISRPGDQP